MTTRISVYRKQIEGLQEMTAHQFEGICKAGARFATLGATGGFALLAVVALTGTRSFFENMPQGGFITLTEKILHPPQPSKPHLILNSWLNNSTAIPGREGRVGEFIREFFIPAVANFRQQYFQPINLRSVLGPDQGTLCDKHGDIPMNILAVDFESMDRFFRRFPQK